ncbi:MULTISPECIES: NAD(P)-dependent oxidoreductase [Vagococcus]|uniref:D-3-phosphoglycerate dehydrogenase n=1 Tax=Vagococcus fluvialis bH819 TaxID=1255619 RepID=A0A1X6WU48_9ENTE|nr:MULTISPECIES: NAD(P)-dependent oxidoreductase [Vagococcus]SLM87146.1 D-3-phosphoglycerate dehydrogenase [Vagococcus fluvialis bH819]HCM90041.1 hydroxyacid dehydrogenase [Vagococcus sp.]
MEKAVILVSVPLTDKELENMKSKTSKYEVIKLEDFKGSIDRVEVMYGWDETIGKKILMSPTSCLKWIQAQSSGVDHLDLETIKKRQIILTNASGVHINQLSESILGMIFAHTRNLKEAAVNQEKSLWKKPKTGTDLFGKTIMIVGTGHIGERLAEILKVFHTKIIGVNRSGRKVPGFDDILTQENIKQRLKEADIVIGLLPGTDETQYFFSSTLFEEMKEGVIFINVGRGSTVKTADLIDYCQNGKIAFAGLDVFEIEPLPENSPLWKLDNVLITPHSSGISDQYYKRLYPIFMENLCSYIEKKKVIKNEIN